MSRVETIVASYAGWFNDYGYDETMISKLDIGRYARQFFKDCRGGIALEYSLLGVLIAVAISGAVFALGNNSMVQPYDDISNTLSGSE